MPDLDEQLRDLVAVSEPDRRPLTSDSLHARAARARRANRARVLVPSIVVVVAIVVAGVALARGRDSALDVVDHPGPAPRSTEEQQVVDRLGAVVELRHALAIESLWTADAEDAPGTPASPELVAARAETDARLAELRATVVGDVAVERLTSWRATQTRLNQMPVIRRTADLGQSEMLEIVLQYDTTLTELDGLSREVRASTASGDASAFDRFAAFAAQTDAEATTWAMAMLAVRVGFFPSNMPSAARPDPGTPGLGSGCGYDAAAAGQDCGIYEEIGAGFDRSRAPAPDVTLDATYLTRLQQVLDLGRGRNDLTSIDPGPFAADARAHLERRVAAERQLLAEI